MTWYLNLLTSLGPHFELTGKKKKKAHCRISRGDNHFLSREIVNWSGLQQPLDFSVHGGERKRSKDLQANLVAQTFFSKSFDMCLLVKFAVL